MNVNTEKLKQIRKQQGWSQEHLSTVCNVNLRTIQRVESRGTASAETLQAIAAAFGISTSELLASDSEHPEKFSELPVLQMLKKELFDFSNFSGVSSRYEFWWFFLAFILVLSIASTLHPILLTLVSIVLLVPYLAISTRRLNDAKQSPHWQWFYLVPFGQIIVLYMLSLPSEQGNKKIA